MEYIFVIALGGCISYLIGYCIGISKGRHETIKIKKQKEKLKKFISIKEFWECE